MENVPKALIIFTEHAKLPALARYAPTTASSMQNMQKSGISIHYPSVALCQTLKAVVNNRNPLIL